MQADFWHERWQRVQIGFHQQEINLHLRQYWGRLRIPAAATVFVPLCGKSGDMLWLRAQGHPVIGVELSPLAVRAFFEENDLQPQVARQGVFDVYEVDGVRIYCGDFFELRPEHLADVTAVYDRASLIALPPEMRPAYAAHMHALLNPGTQVLLVAFEYPQHEMNGPPFSVAEAEVHALYDAHCSVRKVRGLDILEQEPRFRARGITRLQEKIYLLAYNAGSR